MGGSLQNLSPQDSEKFFTLFPNPFCYLMDFSSLLSFLNHFLLCSNNMHFGLCCFVIPLRELSIFTLRFPAIRLLRFFCLVIAFHAAALLKYATLVACLIFMKENLKMQNIYI